MRRYVAAGGWAPARVADRPSALDGLGGWVAERLRRHRGNADVVRQDLAREHGIAVSLRPMQRACAPHRRITEIVVEPEGEGGMVVEARGDLSALLDPHTGWGSDGSGGGT